MINKISIIVPTKNEEEHIGECLAGILKQNVSKDMCEVIVVDGMSMDNTRNIIDKYKGKLNIRVLIDKEKQRVSGINLGIKASRGNIVMRVDSRSVLSDKYIEQCVKTLDETKADNVGGIQKPLARNIRQEAIGIALSHPFGIGDAQFRLGKKSGFVDTVYLGCFRREVFDKVGLFDEEAPVISEDSDMNQRIRAVGGKVYLNKDIVVGYYPRDKFKELIL